LVVTLCTRLHPPPSPPLGLGAACRVECCKIFFLLAPPPPQHSNLRPLPCRCAAAHAPWLRRGWPGLWRHDSNLSHSVRPRQAYKQVCDGQSGRAGAPSTCFRPTASTATKTWSVDTDTHAMRTQTNSLNQRTSSSARCGSGAAANLPCDRSLLHALRTPLTSEPIITPRCYTPHKLNCDEQQSNAWTT
jgi:hypothetical protein